MKTKKSLSVCVTAYNEEEFLEKTVNDILKILKQSKIDFEILIINDGSSDRTGEIADRLAKKHNKIRVIHHKKNMGIGYTIKEGINESKKDFFTYIPGDYQFTSESLKEYIKKLDKYDLLIGYIANPENRPLHRRIASILFLYTIKFLFNIKVKYTNGLNIIKKDLLKNLKLNATGHSISSEIIIKILKFRNPNYINIKFYLRRKESNRTTAFRLPSIMNAIYFTFRLWIELYLLRKKY